MPRPPRYKPLQVFLNHRLVGHLVKNPAGAISFRYHETWWSQPDDVPVSLSLPLREDAYKGEPVSAVFENLLPDSAAIRKRLAEKAGAKGTDACSLLARIGRDCSGALQFVPEGEPSEHHLAGIQGKAVSDEEIENLLTSLPRAPLGVDPEQDEGFRISLAGAQEKTALLFHQGKWWKPYGSTPTTHILKKPITVLQNGLKLSNSVENEYYCLKLLSAFGLPVNKAEIRTFGKAKALVVERFDRIWTPNGRLLRVPQEDCCQALSCPPTRKYQNQGGPGIVDILRFLGGADAPEADQKTFLKAQILFWLVGATNGHAKNFSVFLGTGGSFRLAPLYDVLTAQPSVDARLAGRNQMKMAMFVGDRRGYLIDDIEGQHFIQSAINAGLHHSLAEKALEEIASAAGSALKTLETQLPQDFPKGIHSSVKKAVASRLRKLLK